MNSLGFVSTIPRRRLGGIGSSRRCQGETSNYHRNYHVAVLRMSSLGLVSTILHRRLGGIGISRRCQGELSSPLRTRDTTALWYMIWRCSRRNWSTPGSDLIVRSAK